MDEFIVPAEPAELWREGSDLPFKVQELQDLSDSPAEDVAELAEGVAFRLCDGDPLCVVEQPNFDQLCSLLRAWPRLEGPQRRALLDALCSSLTCLTAWVDKLLSAPAMEQDREALATNRSAFKAYVFFLQWLAEAAARESRAAEAAAAPAASAASAATSGRGGGRGRKKAAAVQEVAGWEWGAQFPKVVKAVAQALNADLRVLFRPNRPEQGLMTKAIQLASAALELPATAKNEQMAGHAAHILCVCALRYDQLDVVTSAVVELLNKYEHTPDLVAELLRYSEATWGDSRLAAGVIAEVAAVDSAEYERQQKATGEKAGVRSVAQFVEQLASRLPRVMAQQISLLTHHLGGEAHVLRCATVNAIGQLLSKVFRDRPSGDELSEEAQRVWVLNKQELLEVLCQRIADKSAFVRKEVLQTWQMLAAEKAIPIGHWQFVTDFAVGRLSDKSPLVRKEALRLLRGLMLDNPFLDTLSYERYATSLQQHEAMLKLLVPPEEEWQPIPQVQQEGGGPAGREEEAGGDGAGAGEDTNMGEAAGEGEEGQPADEEMQDPAAAAEEEDAAATGEEQAAQQEAPAEEAPRPPRQPALTPAEVGWHDTVEKLVALVASLKSAANFTAALTATLPVLEQLLASSAAAEVQETILVLLTCKQFSVDGAPATIKKMLPLIFSREANIKAHIVDALDQLYIKGWAGHLFTSEQAAHNLIELASGATLGELGSLEEVVKEFVATGCITPVMLHELWGIADKAHEALTRGAVGAERAHRDLRAALALLSMVAACNPQAFSRHHVASLLRFGFSARCPDALVTRHACVALQRLVDGFQSGLYDDVADQVFSALTRTIIASPLPEASWFSAAEAALAALYTLHPAPEQLAAAVLRHMAGRAFRSRAVEAAVAAAEEEEGAQEGGEEPSLSGVSGAAGQGAAKYSVSALSRFFFVLGHIALLHLVYVERSAKAVRRARHEAEKAAAEERAERMASGSSQPDKEEDINAQLGVGSVAADAELDALKEGSERQILAMHNLLGPYARVVQAVCANSELLRSSLELRGAALLALTKLMVVDEAFCSDNLARLFWLFRNSTFLDPGERSNLIIALGDLALRFPNLLEPYTECFYHPLADRDVTVRKNAMMVLTHLILNDMMKVKGHIAKMAVCLEDEEQRIAELARLFFSELAKKEYKGTNPIYNLLPDILSSLSSMRLEKWRFQAIMDQLLVHVQKDKMGDALIEKLCQRFAATDDAQQWHNIAFCLTKLPSSDKGLKKLCEGFKLYKHALGDEEVVEAIRGIFMRAKKGSAKPEVKALIEDFELKLTEYAAERAEEERTAEAARLHAERRRGGAQPTATDATEEEGEEEEGEEASGSQERGEAHSDLLSDVRGQMAGLDLNTAQQQQQQGAQPAVSQSTTQFSGVVVKPDPDGPEPAQPSGPVSEAVSGEQGPGDAAEQEGEEDGDAALAPPSTARRGRGRSGGAARGRSSSRPTRASARKAAAQAQPAEESETEGEEAPGEASPEPAPQQRTRRASTRAGRGRSGTRTEAAGEEEAQEENTSSAANAPSGRSRVAALAAKFGGAVAQQPQQAPAATGRRASTRHRAGQEAAGLAGELAGIQIKEEPL